MPVQSEAALENGLIDTQVSDLDFKPFEHTL